ncbi:hypothetical protein [Nonomuraea sp. NPDC050786]|uniref:hypothetical protein n=1 Tax=Nonomuraea sp. NPDC050786 TaxID=3154840 RepID=UPI0033BFF584
MSPEEKTVLELEIRQTLDLPPRLLRLLSAVHEAGHAVVAQTLGMWVWEVHVVSHERIGMGGDRCQIREDMDALPTVDYVAMLLAGAQASGLWFIGRGRDPRKDPDLTHRLNNLAGTDLEEVWARCQTLGMSKEEATPKVQATIRAANIILQHRWIDVLGLAYAVARRGSLVGQELFPYLHRPAREVEAREAYRVWQEENADLWPAEESRLKA